jgi:hypothetical protein
MSIEEKQTSINRVSWFLLKRLLRVVFFGIKSSNHLPKEWSYEGLWKFGVHILWLFLHAKYLERICRLKKNRPAYKRVSWFLLKDFFKIVFLAWRHLTTSKKNGCKKYCESYAYTIKWSSLQNPHSVWQKDFFRVVFLA